MWHPGSFRALLQGGGTTFFQCGVCQGGSKEGSLFKKNSNGQTAIVMTIVMIIALNPKP